jgi:hypothetical protein
MAGKVDQNAANELVRENFGLTADDLGMNPGEDSIFSDNDSNPDDLDDAGGDNNNLGSDENSNVGDDPLFEASQEKQVPVQQQQTPPQSRIPQSAEVKVDGKGNLVNRQTGQIVAKAGAEARMYQKLHKTEANYRHLEAQHNDVTTRLNKAIELGTGLYNRLQEIQQSQAATAPKTFGLSDAEAIEALNFAKEAKVNPVGTIQKLLTKAASSGIDLTSIGLSGGNFDPKSLLDLVRGEINNAMNPLKERSQRETAQEQAQREANERSEQATRDLNSFLSANPEAREYLPVFAKVYERPEFQHMSLGEVWAKLQLNLLRRQGQQRPPNRQQNRRPGVPSGQRSAPRGTPQNSGLASVDTSYEDIVRDLLK